MESRDFIVAEHRCRISFTDNEKNGFALLPSYTPFATTTADDNLLFTLDVDDTLMPDKEREEVGDFELGDGSAKVSRRTNGGYQYIIRDTRNRPCCLLKTDKEFSHCCCALNGDFAMRSFGLNDALMFIFAFAGSHEQTLLIHASTILNDGWGYPFIAKSGTGKSTHSQLWLKHIPGSELMNDDNPVVRVVDGKPYIYGSPWSGKTPCYKQLKAPLGAVTRIDRAPANSIDRLNPVQAFASILPCCSAMKWDKEIYDGICNTITRVIETTPVFTLHCLPDEEAAIVCHQAVAREN